MQGLHSEVGMQKPKSCIAKTILNPKNSFCLFKDPKSLLYERDVGIEINEATADPFSHFRLALGHILNRLVVSFGLFKLFFSSFFAKLIYFT